MIFIGGISSGTKQIDYLRTVICERCGAYGRYQVYMTYMYFSFFFIPLFKWNRRFYVKMSCCGSVYELSPDVGRRLLRGEDLDIAQGDLTPLGADVSCTLQANRLRRCPACGYETNEDFAYCPKCGGKLE